MWIEFQPILTASYTYTYIKLLTICFNIIGKKYGRQFKQTALSKNIPNQQSWSRSFHHNSDSPYWTKLYVSSSKTVSRLSTKVLFSLLFKGIFARTLEWIVHSHPVTHTPYTLWLVEWNREFPRRAGPLPT